MRISSFYSITNSAPAISPGLYWQGTVSPTDPRPAFTAPVGSLADQSLPEAVRDNIALFLPPQIEGSPVTWQVSIQITTDGKVRINAEAPTSASSPHYTFTMALEEDLAAGSRDALIVVDLGATRDGMPGWGGRSSAVQNLSSFLAQLTFAMDYQKMVAFLTNEGLASPQARIGLQQFGFEIIRDGLFSEQPKAVLTLGRWRAMQAMNFKPASSVVPVINPPVAPPAAPPAAPVGLQARLAAIGTDGRPVWQSLLPPEVVSYYTNHPNPATGQIDIQFTAFGERSVYIQHIDPEGAASRGQYQFSHQLIETADGGVQIFEIVARDESRPFTDGRVGFQGQAGFHGFGALDGLIAGLNQAGYQTVSLSNPSYYHDAYIYLHRYGFELVPGATRDWYLGIEAQMAGRPELQLPSELPTADNAAEWERVMLARDAHLQSEGIWDDGSSIRLPMQRSTAPLAAGQPEVISSTIAPIQTPIVPGRSPADYQNTEQQTLGIEQEAVQEGGQSNQGETYSVVRGLGESSQITSGSRFGDILKRVQQRIAALPPGKQLHILTIGPGNGNMEAELMQALETLGLADRVAIDTFSLTSEISPENRPYIQDEYLGNIDYNQLPHGQDGAGYDLVLSINGTVWAKDQTFAVQQVYDALAVGGEASITVLKNRPIAEQITRLSATSTAWGVFEQQDLLFAIDPLSHASSQLYMQRTGAGSFNFSQLPAPQPGYSFHYQETRSGEWVEVTLPELKQIITERMRAAGFDPNNTTHFSRVLSAVGEHLMPLNEAISAFASIGTPINALGTAGNPAQEVASRMLSFLQVQGASLSAGIVSLKLVNGELQNVGPNGQADFLLSANSNGKITHIFIMNAQYDSAEASLNEALHEYNVALDTAAEQSTPGAVNYAGVPLVEALTPDTAESATIESVMEHFEESLGYLRNVHPEIALLVEAHLWSLTPEEIAALDIDTNNLRDLRLFIAEVQEGGVAIENGAGYDKMVDLLNDLGINANMEVFSQVTGQMFALRLKARYGNEVADIILSQVDFSDFSRSQFKTMMNAIHKAYLGNNSAINYLSNIYSAEQIMTIRTTLGNQDIQRFEQLAASGQPLSSSQYKDFQNFVKQLQKSFNAELLAALGGQQRLDTLSNQVEAAQQVAQTPTAPPAAAAAPVSIVDILKNKFDLSETEVQQVIELLSRPGLTEQQFLSQLMEMGLSINIDTLKQTINQALMDELTARAAANPEFSEALQAQFNMHGGRLSIGSIISEIGQECGQEYTQGGILAILKTNSPLVQFLLEPVVEGEFWSAMARGNFGVLKQFFGEMMPATSAGMVGAGIYNAILSAFGVSAESTARGLLPQITVGVMSTIGYSALTGAGASSSAFVRTLSRLLSNPMTQRIFVALALNGPITSQMSSWMGYSNEFAVGAAIASQDHPTAYGVLSSILGSEWATMILNDSGDIRNYELRLAGQAGQAEATGHNLMDALSALVLLYVAKNPPLSNPELYTDAAHQVITDNPDLSDPAYYQRLIGFLSQSLNVQSNPLFDPAVLLEADPLAGDDPAQPAVLPDFLNQNGPQLNQAELAYAMLVGIAQGQDLSEQRPIYEALGLMDSEGQPEESNPYVQEGQQLFAARRQNEERVGLITEIDGFIAHEGEEAIEQVQATNRQVDQARAANLVPYLDVNLPPELLGDSRGVIDPAALMHYVIDQNQGTIDEITAEQQKIQTALDLIVRGLAGEQAEIDFNDPIVQTVLNFLKNKVIANL
jgi:hypothetical protein